MANFKRKKPKGHNMIVCWYCPTMTKATGNFRGRALNRDLKQPQMNTHNRDTWRYRNVIDSY